MRVLLLAIALIFGGILQATAQDTTANLYVGSKRCAECHPDEYHNFSTHSKKSKSWDSVAIMQSDLTPQELEGCYDCHTTGHGKPGGFVNIKETPNLAEVGCETCHGPGQQHVESDGDPELISRKLTSQDCMRCHNEERVANFRYKPLIVSGAH